MLDGPLELILLIAFTVSRIDFSELARDGVEVWLDTFCQRFVDHHYDIIQFEVESIFKTTSLQDPLAKVAFLLDIAEALRNHMPTIQVIRPVFTQLIPTKA